MPHACPSNKRGAEPLNLQLPSDEELLAVVRERPLLSLRELAGALWPGLPWLPAAPGGDSAAEAPRTFAGALGAERMTAAAWLRRRLLALVACGAVRLGAFRRGEPLAAGLTYYVPGAAEAPIAPASRPRAVPLLEEVRHAAA